MVKKTAIDKFTSGQIDAAEYFRLSYLEQKGQTPVPEPVKKSDDPALIEKCMDRSDPEGSEAAYKEYLSREKAESLQLRKAAYTEMDEAYQEFECLLRSTVRKEHETKEQLERRVWAENEDLYLRYERASRDALL